VVQSTEDDRGAEVRSGASTASDPSKRILLGPALANKGGFHSRLGRMLFERGLVTREELQRALERQQSSGERLGEALVGLGALSTRDLARVLADQLHMPFIDIQDCAPDTTLLGVLAPDVAQRLGALPVSRWGTKIVIAMADPNRPGAAEELRRSIDSEIVIAMADPVAVRALIEQTFVSADTTPGAAHAAVDVTESATTDVEGLVHLICPGCHKHLTAAAMPWVLQAVHPHRGRYYIWDDDPAHARPLHICTDTPSREIF
jgi:hypothetical protein